MLHAGAASVDITPSSPQWLDGYGNRTAPSEGAYQPITAKGLALRFGETGAVLVSAEVLGFDRTRVPALKARIAARAGVAAENVILAATHTHCAPRVCDMVMPGEVDAGYRDWFEARCVDAAAGAWEQLSPVRVRVSKAEDRLGINRRARTEQGTIMRPNPNGPHDRDVDTVWFEEPTGSGVRASLTVAACHPTCRGGQQLGGDYPGFLLRELEREAGGVGLFVLGCAGDVRPHFTGEHGGFRMASLEEVERAGKDMGEAVLAARKSARPVECRDLQVRRREVEIPLAEPPGEEELRHVAAEDSNLLKRAWAGRMLQEGADRLPRSVSFEIQLLSLAPGLGVLFWPGEVVADYALWVKSLDNLEVDSLIAGAYANGAVGYVPSAAMYPYGGYEVNGSHHYYNLPAPYAPDVEERLRHATVELLAGQGRF